MSARFRLSSIFLFTIAVKSLVLSFPQTFHCSQRLQFYDASGNAFAPEDHYDGPWARQFTFQDKAVPGQVTINGTLAQRASGTWEVSGGDGVFAAHYSCDGTWTAVEK